MNFDLIITLQSILVGEVRGVWSKRQIVLVWVLAFTVLGNQELLVPRGCPLSSVQFSS